MTKTLTLRKSEFERYNAKDLWKQLCKQVGADPFAELIEVEAESIKNIMHEEDKSKHKAINPQKSRQLALDLSKSDYSIIELDDEEEEPTKEEDLPEIQAPEDNILSDTEKEHAAIMERLAKKCYSKKEPGFTEWEKIEAIEKELQGSRFKKVKVADPHYSLWAQPAFNKCDKSAPIFLITSHADNVSSITKPSSKVTEDGWFYHGTYDNLGTNAASVILMKEQEMPTNVLFAFTANEESGKCTGLKHIVKQLKRIGYEKICGIALDVTYEGHDEGYLYSLENVSNDSFIEATYNAAIQMEPENQTFSFTPFNKEGKPTKLTKDYFSGSFGMFDEAMAFARESVPGCSFCLPCDGEMHGNSGLDVRQATFEGYLLSLTSFIYSMTHTNEKKIEEYKEKRNALAEKNQIMVSYETELAKQRKSYTYNYSYSPATSFYNPDDFEDPDDYEEAEMEAFFDQEQMIYYEAFENFGYTHTRKEIEKLEKFMDGINEDLYELAAYGLSEGADQYVETATENTPYKNNEDVATMIKATYYMAFPDDYLVDHGLGAKEDEFYDDSEVPFDD